MSSLEAEGNNFRGYHYDYFIKQGGGKRVKYESSQDQESRVI